MTSYREDVAFLRSHVGVVELGVPGGPRVAVVPTWQGRVMTSCIDEDAPGYGWINRALIASGEVAPKINAFGGEDRLWLGPEGGQFSIFTPPGGRFDLEDWRTPAGIDTEAYTEIGRDGGEVRCAHEARFQNWSGTEFDVAIRRDLRLRSRGEVAALLDTDIPAGVRAVAFESVNTITNAGALPWEHATGLLSVWTIGMFRHGPDLTVVVPFRPGPEAELGPVVNDAYFGPVPADRLVVDEAVLFFKGDGQLRSKIGIGPRRARDRLGSYDPATGTLTIVQFDLPEGIDEYVNSMWEHQDRPYGGDVINSYNDGAWGEGGAPLGPFYELETSSPAAALAPGGALTHTHRTVHLAGSRTDVDAVARATLGAPLERIEGALRV